MKIRYLGPYCYANNQRRIATFFATIPVSYVVVRMIELLFVMKPSQKFPAIAIAAGVPIIIDGIALTFFPHLYENPDVRRKDPRLSMSFSRMGAAWLLYGLGFSLLMAPFTS